MAKVTYTYKLVKTSVVPYNNEQYVYPNANNYYTFKIELSPTPSGFAKGKFKVVLENAKFPDGTTIKENLHENVQFSVIYDDILNQNGIVKIETATPVDTGSVTLKADSQIQFSYAIAS
jgi:hypothetical protein